MYFLREQGVLGALGGAAPAAEIKVDGKSVGAVTNGSYIFVDRSPGLYKLAVQAGISLALKNRGSGRGRWCVLFNTLGVPRTGAPGMDLVDQAYAGGSGQQMRAQTPLSSGFSAAVLYSLDPPAGAAAIAQFEGTLEP